MKGWGGGREGDGEREGMERGVERVRVEREGKKRECGERERGVEREE